MLKRIVLAAALCLSGVALFPTVAQATCSSCDKCGGQNQPSCDACNACREREAEAARNKNPPKTGTGENKNPPKESVNNKGAHAAK